MTAKTAWASGSLSTGNVFYPLFLAADLNSLATGASVMSSLSLDNTAALDQFMDLSYVGALAAAQTVAAGAGVGLWLACLNADGATYGGGRFTAGTQLAAFNPLLDPLGGIPIEPGAAITAISGLLLNTTLPPRVFRFVAQNQTGFAWAASGNMISGASYRQNVNA
jgi:hypothetical protein